MFLLQTFLLLLLISYSLSEGKLDDKRKCPKVEAIRNFDLKKMMGIWHVVQSYDNFVAVPIYKCIRIELSSSMTEITMSNTYIFDSDRRNRQHVTNSTWFVSNPAVPSRWTYTRNPYARTYKTFIVDTDYSTWALLIHCKENLGSPRYLSSLIMSRTPILNATVTTYLRNQLPQYDVNLSYMFETNPDHCNLASMPPFVAETTTAKNVSDES